MRSVAVVAVVAALCATGACGLRFGEGSPASLPTASASETVRDALARQTVLISTTATAIVASGAEADPAAVQDVADAADVQLQALGGVWDPWSTPVPTRYPTASPVVTAAPTADREDLVAALGQGVQMARDSAAEAGDATTARLYAALAVAWTLELDTLSPESVEVTGRDAASMTEPLPGDLLVAYDAARYAMEEVGARAGDGKRDRAVADSAQAGGLVSASLALGGEDTRLAAYAAPGDATGAQADIDVAWAQQVWLTVRDTELASVGAKGGEATLEAIDAAVDAGARATAWGAATEPLPGHAAG